MLRTLYHSEVAPYWTRRNREYTIFPNFGKDKSGLRFGREGQWAIREGRYKFVFDYGQEYLYNMLADPKEENPIQDPHTRERLKGKLLNWWQEIVADFRSFTTPRFYIGYPGSTSGVILPSATAEKQGSWTLREHWVDGRVSAGDYMSYNVNVARAGGYQIWVCQGCTSRLYKHALVILSHWSWKMKPARIKFGCICALMKDSEIIFC